MTVERIDQCFSDLRAQGKPALVIYLTVGYPSVEETSRYALAALDAGADILELGVPFSDPTADGPVIAAASYHAIHHGGSLSSSLDVAQAIRQKSQKPVVLFGYYNPILSFGEARLVEQCGRIGVDALLVVDLPPEEGAELRAAAERDKLAMIPLIAPTTGLTREPRVLASARGFVYYVSVTGVTGSGTAPLEQAGREAAELGRRAGLPVVVGFGITSPEKARSVAAQGVDGVVVGTAIIKAIAEAPDPDARESEVRRLVGAIRKGLDARN